ncbi:tripartite tricarboxylate transporter substrate binding protein [Bordetella petrii]|uniref:tripartite tricarboxylate transporter substrate binding protein n=1 Tax=Bordetella petrii TaxID=94624 RepID=UPI001E2882CB|nr:tripartite tricarboxylate transporter substrate-binding protein [Bordetella petrii]MCD0503973.1 tripartite tricarboxylate transporter substrate binding protein [Bordetella petrii]
MNTTQLWSVGLVACAALAGTAAQAQQAWQPERPIEFVASAGAGGGTDIFARAIQSVITKNKLTEAPIIVTNKGGGSGAEAYIYAKGNAGDPYKVYFGTQEVYVLPIASKLSYSVSDVTPVSTMIFDPFLLWVNPESGIKDVAGFIQRAKQGGMKVGGARAKEADETLVSQIQNAIGAKFIYIPFRSGSETSVQLAGGHIQANVNNPSESLEQWRAGKQKPLCVFSAERMPGKEKVTATESWSDIPTCKEAGLDVPVFEQPRMMWLAAGTPPDAVAYYRDLFKRVSESPDWQAYVARAAQIPRVITGDALSSFVKQDQARYAGIYTENGWAKK